MLKIFEQIFRLPMRSASGYPDELVQRATERVVDATDPRIRILSSYARKMRPAVVHAIDCAVRLVNDLAAPVPMSGADGDGPIVDALFASRDSMRQVIACDGACRDFAETNAPVAEPVIALLLAKYSQKNTFGYDLVDDRTVADAPLTVVSFDEHRLIGLATREAETRRLLQLRAFDYLLGIALAEISEIREQRQDLQARKKLLKAKLDIVARGGGLLDEPRLAERRELQQKMERIEAALAEAGADDSVLQRNLDAVIAALAGAEQRLWLERRSIHVDNLHYLRGADCKQAVELPLQMLHDARAREAAAWLVAIPPERFQHRGAMQ